MKQPKESLQRFQQRPEEIISQGIVVQRLTDKQTGDQAIKLFVDPNQQDWQQTDIGRLRIAGITSIKSRDSQTPMHFIRVEFGDDAFELHPYNKRRGKGVSNGHRDIPVDESTGIGWQELGMDIRRTDWRNRVIDPRQKWIIVDIGSPIVSTNINLANAAHPIFEIQAGHNSQSPSQSIAQRTAAM